MNWALTGYHMWVQKHESVTMGHHGSALLRPIGLLFGPHPAGNCRFGNKTTLVWGAGEVPGCYDE
jgi:hypothetical protein